MKKESNTLEPLQETVVRNEEHAIQMFEAQGGQLQREWQVGCGPLSGDDVCQQQRKHLFSERHCFEDVFTAVVSGDPSPFKRGLEYFMRLTYSL